MIATVGLCLRIPVVLQPFWLDEIWSYYLVSDAASAWYIVAELTHSNNHILNSLFMWLLGDQSSWVLYRLLSLVSGIATIVLMGYAGHRISAATGYIAAILGACSVPLILYSGEARGYAPLAFFALLAAVLMPSPGDEKAYKLSRLASFWAAAVLGILAQITFSFVLAGLFASWAAIGIAQRIQLATAIKRLAQLFLVPGLTGILVVGNIYLNVAEESGNQSSALDSAVQILLQSAGLGYIPSGFFLAALIAAAILFGGAALAGRSGVPWILIVCIVPGIIFNIIEPPYMFPRYFMASVPFFLLALATLLGWLWERKYPGAPVIASLLLAVLLAGSAFTYKPLVTYGKGDYLAAIRSMYEASGEATFTVGSDHDFRNRMLLGFYSRYVEHADRMSYVGRHQLLEASPDFFLVHSFVANDPPLSELRLGEAANYVFISSHRHSGPSGWTWHIYRKNSESD